MADRPGAQVLPAPMPVAAPGQPVRAGGLWGSGPRDGAWWEGLDSED